jgi:C-terminal processing protease CtpA/Prc
MAVDPFQEIVQTFHHVANNHSARIYRGHCMDHIDRLVGLCKVWCATKFFHPYLAYRNDIDWDQALIHALPKVLAAENADAYAGAMQSMLSALGDSVSRVRPHGRESQGPAPQGLPFSRDADGGVLVVSFRAVGDDDWDALIQELQTIQGKLAQLRGLVLDMRGSAIADFCFSFSGLDRELSATPLAGPGQRSRIHLGFAQQGGAPSGDYHSALQTADGKVYAPPQDARDLPCVFLLDEETRAPRVALALQKAGKAAIMVEGDACECALVRTASIDIGEGLAAHLRISEIIYADGCGGFAPDVSLPASAGPDALIKAALAWLAAPKERVIERKPLPAAAAPTPERAYAETNYPSLEHRLLAAFRIWGVIHTFFPYKELITEDWQGVLREFLPRFQIAADATAYAMTIAEMVTRIGDSHCSVQSAKLDEHIGVATPAVRVRMIEGLPVVTDIYDQAIAGLDVGDVVIAVDGVDAKARAAMLSRCHSASTPQALDMVVAARLLCGPDASAATLTVHGGDGKRKDIKLPRAKASWAPMAEQRGGEMLRMLTRDIGYADLDRLPVAGVDDMFERFKDTKAIIFDMRGYPHGTAWAIAPRLTERNDVAAALIERPIVSADVISSEENLGGSAVQRSVQRVPRTDKWRYKGRTVMLMDERTFSQAEHTGLFFKAANDTLLVGSPTVGANGDVTQFVVPGDIWIGFTGQAIKHADGRQLQRVGLIPDVEIRPTIAGIRAGRDEVLEKAIDVIEAGSI